jgi:hypothetical protein
MGAPIITSGPAGVLLGSRRFSSQWSRIKSSEIAPTPSVMVRAKDTTTMVPSASLEVRGPRDRATRQAASNELVD